MTPYTQHKIKELTEFMKALSQRQKFLRGELHGNYNREYKNLLHIEQTTNSTVLRCAAWIKMTLQGKSLEYKLLVDKHFVDWMMVTQGFYVQGFLARLWNWPEEKYINPCNWKIWRWNHVYFNQRQLFYYIYDFLFPDKAPGVFGFGCDEDIECDTWRTYFCKLLDLEREKVKELRKY